MKKGIIIALIITTIGASVFANGTSEAKNAYPSQSIELVIPASAGGGSDIMGRLLVDIIQKNNFCTQTIIPINKPGGSGATGQAYVNAKQNPDYTIFTVNDAHTLGANVAGTVPEGNFKCIAMLACDEVLFVTKNGSPYTTMDEAITAIKANPGKLTVGCADKLDKICVTDINNSYGVNFNNVYFDGAGEIATAILGGHIEFGIFNPSECSALVEAGELKALALFSEKRTIAPFAEVPTFTEMGHKDLVYKMTRGILGNAKMSREAQLYWSGVFEKVCQQDAWQKGYVEANGITPMYMNCDDYSKYYVENEKSLLKKLAAIGE